MRVRATAVNRADILQRQGKYPPPPGSPADVPGMELAGEVDALGDGVVDWAVGDRVFGLVGGGSYAEYVVVHGRTLARMPDGMTFTDAAAVPEAFVTAWDALVTQANLSAGETVLVHAAGSGVGTAGVQIARAIGARTVGTARTSEKLERAVALGLSVAIVVAGSTFAGDVLKCTGGQGVDVVLDLVGGPYVAEDLACLAPRGRILVVGTMGGASVQLDLALLMTSGDAPWDGPPLAAARREDSRGSCARASHRPAPGDRRAASHRRLRPAAGRSGRGSPPRAGEQDVRKSGPGSLRKMPTAGPGAPCPSARSRTRRPRHFESARRDDARARCRSNRCERAR